MRAALFTMAIATPGRDTVTRHVGHVSDPAMIVLKHVDQITASLTARDRASIELEFPNFCVDGRNEDVVNLCGQFHFSVDPQVALGLAD
jgi:hypothetical protein